MSDWLPNSGYDSSKEKAKLQNVMAFGTELEPTPPKPQPVQPQVGEEERDRFEEGENPVCAKK